MTTLVLGVSHRSAPMSVLDAVALSGRSVDLLTERVLGGEYVDGALVLTTCNRLEIVADVRAFHGGLADVGAALVSVTGSTGRTSRTTSTSGSTTRPSSTS